MSHHISPEDYIQLVQLRHRYCHHIDHGKYEQWANLFTEDGTFEIAGGDAFTGHDELVKFGADIFNDLYRFQAHTISNPVLEVDGDEGSGRWYLFMPHVTTEGDPGLVQGQYTDEYRRIDGQWKIDSVFVDVVFRETFQPAE